jgi:hypothetical protein
MSCTCAAIGSSSAGACFSADRKYRYALWRSWGGDHLFMHTKPANYLFVIMLNPSTADEHEPDPTLTRVERFAKDMVWYPEPLNGVVIANAFALRATSPMSLYQPGDNVIGPENDTHLRDLRRRFGPPVLGWGGNLAHPALRPRLAALREILGEEAYAWKVTNDGMPGHPLYLKADTALAPYTWIV